MHKSSYSQPVRGRLGGMMLCTYIVPRSYQQMRPTPSPFHKKKKKYPKNAKTDIGKISHGSYELCPKNKEGKNTYIHTRPHQQGKKKKKKNIYILKKKVNIYSKYEHLEQGMRIQTKWYHEKENM